MKDLGLMTPALSRRSLINIALIGLSSRSAQAAERFVGIRGKDFIGSDGRILHVKGINLGNWLLPEGYMFGFDRTANSPRLIATAFSELIGEEEARRFWHEYRETYITRADINLIARAGFNAVRLPLDYRLFITSDEPRRFAGVGYALLDRLIGWCRSEKIHLILDLHAAPGGQTGDNIDNSFGYPFLLVSPASQALAVAFWEMIARRYGNEPVILGFDLLNEPIADYYNFDVERLNAALGPLYIRMIAAIRKHDKRHIIFVTGDFALFRSLHASYIGRSGHNRWGHDRLGLAYTFHSYWGQIGEDMVRSFVSFRESENVPVWLGESGENTDEWVQQFRIILEEGGIDWCFWPFKKIIGRSCVVTAAAPADWELIVRYAGTARPTLQDVRDARPPAATASRILNGLLDGVRLKNCELNAGYLSALGLRVPNKL